MIVDFYSSTGAWLDSCDASQYDVARLARLLTAKYGPVTSRARGVAVEEPAGGLLGAFSEWLLSV